MSGEYDAGAVSSTALARMYEAGLVAPESVRVFWTSPRLQSLLLYRPQ